MQIKTSASAFIKCSPDSAFDFVTTPNNLRHTFKGFGPIPAIVSDELLDGSQTVKPGVLRNVRMGDNSVLQEKVLTMVRPTSYSYDIVDGIAKPLSYLTRHGHSEWTFRAENSGTLLRWDYGFTLTSVVTYPFAFLVLNLFMRKALQNCLDQTKILLEK